MTGVRHALERVLSKAGVCSRTEARAWIRAGRVRIGGRVVIDPERPCDPARDDVRVDGRKLASEARVYVALHKPRGCITTRSDPEGRSTVYDHLSGLDAWVVPVGRLDADTTGLILLTNDTAFADLVTSPSSFVEKTYVVTARPRLSVEALQRLSRGVELEDGPTRPAVVLKLGDRDSTTRFEITITEGRNREVRRMVRAVGSKVVRLQRRRIGPVELGELESGAWRVLRTTEVSSLRKAARSRSQ